MILYQDTCALGEVPTKDPSSVLRPRADELVEGAHMEPQVASVAYAFEVDLEPRSAELSSPSRRRWRPPGMLWHAASIVLRSRVPSSRMITLVVNVAQVPSGGCLGPS